MHANPEFNFDNFVVTPGNEFAYKACRAFAESESTRFNPIFLHGPVSVGKTHLLNAIGNFIVSSESEKKLIMVSAHNYLNELIQSIRYDKIAEFREKYQNADILVMDDVHLLVGKERTQEELVSTFNALINAGGRLAFSGSVPPQALPALSELLKSRLRAGLVIPIKPPTEDEMRFILSNKFSGVASAIPDELINLISRSTGLDVREAEGAIKQVIFAQSQSGEYPATEEVVNWLNQKDLSEDQNILPERRSN